MSTTSHLHYRLKRNGNSLSMTVKGRNTTPCLRGACVQYSGFSRQRLAELLFGLDFKMVSFITLTYREEIHFSVAKKHLHKFLSVVLRRKIGKFRYIWAQEFQVERGVIHFHILVDKWVPAKYVQLNEKWVYSLSADLWPYGFAVEEYVDYEGGLSKYLAADVSKENQRTGHFFVGRWWGNSRGIVPRSELVVGSDVASLCIGVGVGTPLHKWKGSLSTANTKERFKKVLDKPEDYLV